MNKFGQKLARFGGNCVRWICNLAKKSGDDRTSMGFALGLAAELGLVLLIIAAIFGIPILLFYQPSSPETIEEVQIKTVRHLTKEEIKELADKEWDKFQAALARDHESKITSASSQRRTAEVGGQ